MTSIRLRVNGRLRDFLGKRAARTLVYTIEGRPALRDVVQAVGIPHPEIGRVAVSGSPADLSFRIEDGGRISVYPLNEPMRSSPRFIADVHLGRLARYLRLLGFDTLYRNDYSDAEILRIAGADRRTVLTRDVGLLKNKKVSSGYWLRSEDPKEQGKELLRRYKLKRFVRAFSRCLACNGMLAETAKAGIADLLPPRIRRLYTEFFRCTDCGRIYWKGSHAERLRRDLREFAVA